MKTLLNVSLMAVFLFVCINGAQAQTAQAKLDQAALIKQFLGTWNCNIDKDTLEVWECKPYGDVHTTAVSLTIKGKKVDSYFNCAGFDKRDGKFKGILLFTNGDYYTWIGMFPSDKKFNVDIVDNLDPAKVLAKYEFEFMTPTSRTMTRFSAAGVKEKEYKYTKVK